MMLRKAIEEIGYNVLLVYGSMMIVYLRQMLKLSYKRQRKRRRPLNYIVALNVLTMVIINVFDLCGILFVIVNCIKIV